MAASDACAVNSNVAGPVDGMFQAQAEVNMAD
jgi:hypothetical protein